MKFTHPKTLLVLLIILAMLSGCLMSGRDNDEQVAPTIENRPGNGGENSQSSDIHSAQLALDIGFLDDQIRQAATEGASLFYARTTTVDNQDYAVFYLLTENEPRILNASAMIVLVYEGSMENVGEFIYRLEIKNYVEQSVFESLPTTVITPSTLPSLIPQLLVMKRQDLIPLQ